MKIGKLEIKLGKYLRELWEEEEETEDIIERKSLSELRKEFDHCYNCSNKRTSVCESCTNN